MAPSWSFDGEESQSPRRQQNYSGQPSCLVMELNQFQEPGCILLSLHHAVLFSKALISLFSVLNAVSKNQVGEKMQSDLLCPSSFLPILGLAESRAGPRATNQMGQTDTAVLPTLRGPAWHSIPDTFWRGRREYSHSHSSMVLGNGWDKTLFLGGCSPSAFSYLRGTAILTDVPLAEPFSQRKGRAGFWRMGLSSRFGVNAQQEG